MGNTWGAMIYEGDIATGHCVEVLAEYASEAGRRRYYFAPTSFRKRLRSLGLTCSARSS